MKDDPEEQTRHNLREDKAFECVAWLMQQADRHVGRAYEAWNDGRYKEAAQMKKEADVLKSAALRMKQKFNVDKPIP